MTMYKTTGTLKEIGAKVGDVVERPDGTVFTVSYLELENWKMNDYRIVLPKTERTDSEKGPFCAECDCVNGGVECTWIKSGPYLNRATPTSPVRTVTKTEIVPGVYGKVKVHDPGSKFVRIVINDAMSREDLTAAINTLTEIREAM